MGIQQLTKEQFENNSELKLQFGTFENYEAAFVNSLKKDSIMNVAKNNPNIKFDLKNAFIDYRIQKYDKHNQTAQVMIAKYKLLEKQYQELLAQQSTLNNSLMSKYKVSSNKDLLNIMGEKNALFDRGMYLETANSVSEAYRNYESALQAANYFTHQIV